MFIIVLNVLLSMPPCIANPVIYCVNVSDIKAYGTAIVLGYPMWQMPVASIYLFYENQPGACSRVRDSICPYEPVVDGDWWCYMNVDNIIINNGGWAYWGTQYYQNRYFANHVDHLFADHELLWYSKYQNWAGELSFNNPYESVIFNLSQTLP